MPSASAGPAPPSETLTAYRDAADLMRADSARDRRVTAAAGAADRARAVEHHPGRSRRGRARDRRAAPWGLCFRPARRAQAADPVPLVVGDHALAVHAFVCRNPDENHEGVYRWLLEPQPQLYGVAFAYRPQRRHLPRRAPSAGLRHRRAGRPAARVRCSPTPTSPSTRSSNSASHHRSARSGSGGSAGVSRPAISTRFAAGSTATRTPSRRRSDSPTSPAAYCQVVKRKPLNRNVSTITSVQFGSARYDPYSVRGKGRIRVLRRHRPCLGRRTWRKS